MRRIHGGKNYYYNDSSCTFIADYGPCDTDDDGSLTRTTTKLKRNIDRDK